MLTFLTLFSTMLVQVPLHTMVVTYSLFALLLQVQAYIPAFPTNDTADPIANDLNAKDTSQLNVMWAS